MAIHSKPRRKRRLSSISSRRKIQLSDDDGVSSSRSHAAVIASPAAAAPSSPFASPPTSTIRNHFSSLLLFSVALPYLILIDGSRGSSGGTATAGTLLSFAEAVDPPTVPSTARRDSRGQSPTLPRNNNVDFSSGGTGEGEDIGEDAEGNRREATIDQRADKMIQTVHSPAEDAVTKAESEGAYAGKKADSSSYESKVQKQKQSLPGNRKQRQRQKQRQFKERRHQESSQQATAPGERNNANQQRSLPHESSQSEYDAYMHWCEKVLGIRSVVEIREFEYLDHLQMHWEGYEGGERDEQLEPAEEEFDWLKQYSVSFRDGIENDAAVEELEEEEGELPTKIVRGLAAKHDIQVGDIVLSIPLYSLLSVPTTIDHDPVLSRILGPSARENYGWADTSEYELPLLVLAVLYHRSLGRDSPISHYIDVLLGTDTGAFPFLWSDRELRERTAALGDNDGGGAGAGGGEGVKKLARGLRRDLHDMYDDVVGTLVREMPEWFAPPDNSWPIGGLAEEEDNEAWAYSYENFRWAFALVISRHHYLPISDFDDEDDLVTADRGTIKRPTVKVADPPSTQMHTVPEVVPPANQPTDSWVDLAKNEERVAVKEADDDDETAAGSPAAVKHSFLAPLADLINFGPPCLTGSYNEEEHVFELIATCPFTKGQEVTFWYSSDCSDVIIANFGFLHPLVPRCDVVSAEEEDWEKRSDEWRETADLRQRELGEVYRKMNLLKDELAVLESQLASCGCEKNGEKKLDFSSMPTANHGGAEEASHKLRNGHQHHSRHDIGVRGRSQHGLDQQEITKEMMEELG